MSGEKVSKTNGLGVDPMQRLASFKPPRDYSLGPAKPNKKVFTPNLNATRNKNKGSSSNNTQEHKKEDKGRRDRKNDRNRNFKNGHKVIKSSGVFSEGLGSEPARERQYNRSTFGGQSADSGPVTLQKPTIRIKDVVKIDKELEEQKINMVMNRGVLGNVEMENFNQSNDLEAPIKLPMDNIGSSNSKGNSMVQVKKEVIVKAEPPEDNGMAVPQVDTKPVLDLKMEAFDDTDVVDLLRSANPTMMLIKLPDTLPGRGAGGDDDGPPRRKPAAQPSSPQEASDDNTTTDNKCCLSQLAEGKMGTLQIRRSGRVTLRLGDTLLEVTLGTKSAFHQEIVSVAADATSRSARLVSLGALQHKLTAAPDWGTMFLDAPS